MNILFICKHNRFRSKVAEAIFNNLKISDDRAISRGLKPSTIGERFVADNVIKIMEEKGSPIKDIEAKLIDAIDLKWADKIIIVADNFDPKPFPKKKTVVWSIEDCQEDDIPKIKERVRLIETYVKEYVKNSGLKP